MFNAPPVIRWNIDKHYLNQLARQGIALPQTVWVEQNAQSDLAKLLSDHRMDAAVIKPTISLSAYKTWRTSLAEAQVHQHAFDELVSEQSTIVQSYVEAITHQRGTVTGVFGGSYSHAVRKRPQAGDFRVQMDFGGTQEAVIPPLDVLSRPRRLLIWFTNRCCMPASMVSTPASSLS